jgi:hypothetical protein
MDAVLAAMARFDSLWSTSEAPADQFEASESR